MKKTYSLNILLCILICVLSCKKKEPVAENEPIVINTEMKPGLPDDLKHINGYLYVNSGQHILYDTILEDRLILYANFSDPALNLISGFNHYNTYRYINSLNGNLDVGPIKFNDTNKIEKIIFFPKICFMSNIYQSEQPDTIRWITTGARGYKPINEIVTRGFPEIYPATLDTLNITSSYTLDIKNRVINYDSVTVSINSQYFSVFKTISKHNNTVLAFTPDDLLGIPGNLTQVMVMMTAYNYSYKITDNKTYVYEVVKQSKIDMVPVKH